MTVEWLAERVNELISLFRTVRRVFHAGRWKLNFRWKINWHALGWRLLTRRNPPFITCRGKNRRSGNFFITCLVVIQQILSFAFLRMIAKWNFDHSLQPNIAVSTDVRLFILKKNKGTTPFSCPGGHVEAYKVWKLVWSCRTFVLASFRARTT